MELKSESLPEGKTLAVLPKDCWRAALNWTDWLDDFACPRDNDLPVLSRRARFEKFRIECSVLRGEGLRKMKDPDIFRRELQCLNAGPREDAESVADWLKEATGCRNRHFSLVTKLNAFRSPERFIASDSLNRKGLHKAFEREPKDYVEHLRWCRDLAAALCRSGFVETCFGGNKPFKSHHHAAFAMRVLDCALMRTGAQSRPPRSKDDGQ